MEAEEIVRLARHLAAVDDQLEAIAKAATVARAEIYAAITAPTPAGAPVYTVLDEAEARVRGLVVGAPAVGAATPDEPICSPRPGG